MNDVAGTNIKSNFYVQNPKLYRTDGIFPTHTMRLHQRIVAWHRKRRIPVRDADQPDALNAYLIDPKYLENGEVSFPPSELPAVDPTPPIPIYQYSKITRNTPLDKPTVFHAVVYSLNKPLALFKVGLTALGIEIAARTQALFAIKPNTRYTAAGGVLPWWKQRFRLFAVTLLMGGLLIAAVTLGNDKTTAPTPVSANPNNTSNSHLITAGNTTGPESNNSAHNATKSVDPTTNSAQPATNSLKSAWPSTQPPSVGTTGQATDIATSPVISTSTPPTTTMPLPTGGSGGSTTPPIDTSTDSGLLDPVLDPVLDTVNDVLSTQIIVNSPLSRGSSDEPLVKLNQ